MKVKKNNRLLRKNIKVQTGPLWPYYMGIAVIFFFSGLGATYYLFNGGKVSGFFIKIYELEELNRAQEIDFLALNLKLETLQILFDSASEDNKEFQEKNSKLKEDILFYEKIVGKRK